MIIRWFPNLKAKEKLLEAERRLYADGTVNDKYMWLVRMREVLDILYRRNRPLYEECRAALKPNTWDALEELWTFWNPVPKSHVDWVGREERTCQLRRSHPLYKECAKFGFTECEYDENGSPNFKDVTYPGSVVGVTDLYDKLSVEEIQKRGGSSRSLQEVAQMRMAQNLRSEIEKWAKENGREADFWAWRDAHDIVPHEDPYCGTMYLVYRPAHTAFKHRGGVANAVTVKTHF